MKHRFASILRTYAVPYVHVKSGAGVWKGGKHIPGPEAEVPYKGVIQPLGERILQQDGGRYDEDDRKLYTTQKHDPGDVILYKGRRYTVSDDDDRSDYSDAYQYVLKRVTP